MRPQVHPYVSTGLASSKFGIRNSHLQVRRTRALGVPSGVLAAPARTRTRSERMAAASVHGFHTH